MIRHVITCAVLVSMSALTFAHHSPAVFDQAKEVTITGVVEEFRWGNPHSWIHLTVGGPGGQAETWGVEMDPATLLARRGWKSTTIKPGDKVSVVIHPLRTDEKGGQYVAITLPDGKVLGRRR